MEANYQPEASKSLHQGSPFLHVFNQRCISADSEDDLAITLDLKDAYFHIPIAVRHRRFLQFIWRGQAYRYTALLFGLSKNPLCFTKVTKPVVQHLRVRGYRIVFYLDDVLLLSNSRYSTDRKKKQTIALLQDLGFTLNTEKSSLVPSQTFTYLGLQWNTRDLSVRLPDDKVQELRDLAASLQSRSSVSARTLMAFLGKTNFAGYAVPLARVHSRELQHALRRVYKHPSDITRRVPLSPEAKQDLHFWTTLTQTAKELRQPPAELTMATEGNGAPAFSPGQREASGQRSRNVSI